MKSFFNCLFFTLLRYFLESWCSQFENVMKSLEHKILENFECDYRKDLTLLWAMPEMRTVASESVWEDHDFPKKTTATSILPHDVAETCLISPLSFLFVHQCFLFFRFVCLCLPHHVSNFWGVDTSCKHLQKVHYCIVNVLGEDVPIFYT